MKGGRRSLLEEMALELSEWWEFSEMAGSLRKKFFNLPIFFQLGVCLSLNFAIRSSWSEPQSAPNIVFTDCIELLHLWLRKKYNESDFSIDHLVMSMCRVLSYVVGRGSLLWPVHSLGKTLLAFELLHFVLLGQTCLLFQVSLDFLLLHFNPLW